jgi:hypothetical protein
MEALLIPLVIILGIVYLAVTGGLFGDLEA